MQQRSKAKPRSHLLLSESQEWPFAAQAQTRPRTYTVSSLASSGTVLWCHRDAAISALQAVQLRRSAT